MEEKEMDACCWCDAPIPKGDGLCTACLEDMVRGEERRAKDREDYLLYKEE